MRKTFIVLLWSMFLLGIVSVVGVFMAIDMGFLGYMPDLKQLENPVDKYASQVISEDGKLMGTWSYSKANRIFVDYNEMSPWLVKALVATEDARFYEHSGIDYIGLGRAIVKRGLMRQKNAGGGSTITQQLAKQLYSQKAENTQERLMQKPVEWVIAVKLERFYTKEEIIMMYLNYFDFLHNAVGIKTAAKTYFGKEPKDLDVCESAMLIGMCKNPSYYNPVRVPERALERRNVVLDQMVKAGYLTAEEASEYKTHELGLNYHQVDHKDGVGTYLRDYLRGILMAKKPVRSDYASWQDQQYFEDSLAWETDPLFGWCNKNVKKDGSHYNIYEDGLKIYTTLDSRMQDYAEAAVERHVTRYLQPQFSRELRASANYPYASNVSAQKARENLARAKRQSPRYLTMKADGCSDSEIDAAFNTPVEMTVYTTHGEVDTLMTPLDSLKYYKTFLRCGFMCMDNENGHVKAYVGGVNYTHFQYDMATKGKRQVGSTIKPYLYALAMENGYSPCSVVPDVKRSYGGWTPRGGGSGGMVTLRHALASSNNTVSAYLIDQLRPTQFVRTLREFGVKQRRIDPTYPLCLGAVEISVAEMVGAYTAFPCKGIRRLPLFVTRIEDSEGHVLSEFSPRLNEVIGEESSYKMIELMQGVVDHGTGSRMRRMGIKAPMAGKTGTTNGNTDGWFMGYTPRLTFGAWVGGDERDCHFLTMTYGQGAAAALPICAYFMESVYKDRALGYSQDEKFDIPADFDPCGESWGEEGEISEDGEGMLDELAF